MDLWTDLCTVLRTDRRTDQGIDGLTKWGVDSRSTRLKKVYPWIRNMQSVCVYSACQIHDDIDYPNNCSQQRLTVLSLAILHHIENHFRKQI